MAAPALVILDPAQYRRTPWKNRAGVTIDIAGAHRPGADPGGWEGIIWRLGRTRIERPGPFSDLSGYDRILAVIEGRGLMLHPRDRTPLDVREPFTPVRFAGEWPIVSDLTDGPVDVLNLIADRTQCAIDLAFPEEGTRISVPAGHAIALALGDTTLEIGGKKIEVAHDAAARFDNTAPVEVAALRGRVAIANIRNRQ